MGYQDKWGGDDILVTSFGDGCDSGDSVAGLNCGCGCGCGCVGNVSGSNCSCGV